MKQTDVIFRTYINGEVVALFLDTYSKTDGMIDAYGKDGFYDANFLEVIGETKPSLESKYAPLKEEIEAAGCKLNAVKVFTIEK